MPSYQYLQVINLPRFLSFFKFDFLQLTDIEAFASVPLKGGLEITATIK